MRRVALVAGLAVAIALTAAIWAAALTKGPGDTSYVSTYRKPKETQLTAALFVGDSATVGGDTISERQAFASQTCMTLGWVCNIDGQEGTGYVNDGHEVNAKYSAYVGRVAADKERFLADVIVVSGGRNDRDLPGVDKGAAQLFADQRAAYPQAKLVVLEPFWWYAKPSASAQAMNPAIQRAATAAGATYIRTEGWLTPELLTDDGIYPTAAGHTQLARRLVAELKAAGFA